MTDKPDQKPPVIARKANGQFARGQTGNPKGRPPKPKGREMLPRREDLDAVLGHQMLMEHKYKLNGKETSQPYVVLLLEQLKLDTLKGDKAARKQLLDWYREMLGRQFDDKMALFETLRDRDLMSYWDIQKLNEKM